MRAVHARKAVLAPYRAHPASNGASLRINGDAGEEVVVAQRFEHAAPVALGEVDVTNGKEPAINSPANG
jgi:hypothetical protein